ncbi:MAG: Ezrin/radixin/moesin family protein [Cyclobacteriaceae bacterium]|nr:Ezrin/radixin/moesin family protein [Cyclobacteriaceae bacterium]
MIAGVNISRAQVELSKQETKEWKRKAKDLKKNPAELKRIFEENAALNSEVSGYKRQIASLESRLSEKDADLSKMRQRVQQMESEMAASKQQQEVQSTSGPAYDDSGVLFKVQVGAFRNKDLSKYFENTENFSGETTEDGVQKITLGRFRDYWEADNFKKYLREMGVSDAWIVPYKDGKRVAMKDVLEGVI